MAGDVGYHPNITYKYWTGRFVIHKYINVTLEKH